MKKAELIVEAKKRYPIGTVFLEATGNSKEQYTVEQINDYEGSSGWYDDNHIIIYVKGITGCGKFLYYNGKWAEILSYPDGCDAPVNNSFSLY